MATLRSDRLVSTTPPPHQDNANALTAAEHLVGYSLSDVPLFKRNQLEPVKDLKLLVKDYAPIAKNALTILVNISSDAEVLKSLAKDDALLETLLSRITVCQFTSAHDLDISVADTRRRIRKSRVRMRSQCCWPTWPRMTPYNGCWS